MATTTSASLDRAAPSGCGQVANHEVGDGLRAQTASWSFAGEVPRVFVDHVRHSVPLYDVGHELACDLASCFVGREGGGLGYELGASTGQLLRRLATHGPAGVAARWVGLDREEGMVRAAREHCAGLNNVDVIRGDLLTTSFEPCDFVVAYLTLQFVPPDRRVHAVQRIYDALRPGGAFFVFDKVLAPDARYEALVTTLHYRWKRRAGLSPEEILNKKESLLGVLEPISTQENVQMLRSVGFPSAVSVLKYLCFEGFIAVK